MTGEAPKVTGGCQCGAVRYEITGPLFGPHICHCRMCQKAFGNLFAALVACKKEHLAWVKEDPGIFRSSSIVQRGFCPHCGTPLSFAYDTSDHINVSIGSLDRPQQVAPIKQFGIESTHPSFPSLTSLPGSRTEDDIAPHDLERLRSRQYPDG